MCNWPRAFYNMLPYLALKFGSTVKSLYLKSSCMLSHQFHFLQCLDSLPHITLTVAIFGLHVLFNELFLLIISVS